MAEAAGPDARAGRRARQGDNRFKDEDWQNNFLFDYIKQSYLIAARHIHDDGRRASRGSTTQTAKKVDFYTRQYVDALAPTNFVLTNPEVLRETVRVGGQNLVKGLQQPARGPGARRRPARASG